MHWWLFTLGDLEPAPDYVRAELKWYLEGSKKDLSICDHASIWKDCVDENQEIQSNYGYYVHTQFNSIVEELATDGASRRAVCNINNAEHLYPAAPDVPCTIAMQFLIRNDYLHLIVTMRSQDAVYGLRNDIPAFQMFKLILANELGVKPSTLYINVGSLHVYEKHWDKIKTTTEASAKWQGFSSMREFNRWLDQA